MHSSTETRARLSLVLLLYFLGIIGVITLAPFRFVIPRDVQILTGGDAFDVVANVLLFVPLGFLYPLTRSAADEPSVLRALVLGALLSAAIETAQVFEPDRYPSTVDVLTNTAGAALGAFIVRAMTLRIRVSARFVGRLSLEIPLIGLIYLLGPLLVVTTLSAANQPLRYVALLPLAFVGARLMSTVYRYHFGPSGVLTSREMAFVAAGWTILGTFPMIAQHARLWLVFVVLVGLVTWYESARVADAAREGRERRFESDAIRSAAPYLVAYFAAIVFLPLASGIADWHWDFALTGSSRDIGALQLRLLEPVASLTVLGYLLAEARGRRELPFTRLASRVALECTLVALVIEASRGFQQGTGASVMQFALMVGAGLLGAGMYHNQRQHVRWIVAHRGQLPSVA